MDSSFLYLHNELMKHNNHQYWRVVGWPDGGVAWQWLLRLQRSIVSLLKPVRLTGTRYRRSARLSTELDVVRHEQLQRIHAVTAVSQQSHYQLFLIVSIPSSQPLSQRGRLPRIFDGAPGSGLSTLNL